MPPRTSIAGRRRFINRALARGARVALALSLLLSSALPALAAAGDVDATFNPTPGVTRRGTVSAIAVQPDGKVLVGGNFSGVGGGPRGGVVRLNPDGSPDASFGGSGLGASGSVAAVVLQPDGKILVGGSFTSYDGVARGNILRLNADGSPDASSSIPARGATAPCSPWRFSPTVKS